MSSCAECHGAEGSHHTSKDCPRFDNIFPKKEVKQPPTVSGEIRKLLLPVLVAGKEYKANQINLGQVDDVISEALSKLEDLIRKSKIEENQVPLDRINNFNPGPGQLTTASFGSAGGAMETASWKQYFENRIKALSSSERR